MLEILIIVNAVITVGLCLVMRFVIIVMLKNRELIKEIVENDKKMSGIVHTQAEAVSDIVQILKNKIKIT